MRIPLIKAFRLATRDFLHEWQVSLCFVIALAAVLGPMMVLFGLKFGIIGCGLMGREFASAAARWLHLTDMRARPEIVAVCDTNPALMDWYSDHVPSVRQKTTDYRELLANP